MDVILQQTLGYKKERGIKQKFQLTAVPYWFNDYNKGNANT